MINDLQGTPLPPPAFALSELRLGKPSLREGCRAKASAKADRQSQQTLACAFQKVYADFITGGGARCFDCSWAVGVVMTASWSLVRSHSKRRPLPVRTGGGFRFFRMSGRLARLAGAAPSSRVNSARRRHSAKERPPRGGLSEIGSGVSIRRLRSSASCAGARERTEHDARPLHPNLEVASSGPSAVPQSETN